MMRRIAVTGAGGFIGGALALSGVVGKETKRHFSALPSKK